MITPQKIVRDTSYGRTKAVQEQAGMPARTYNVLAVESDNGITFSPIVNLFGPPNGPTGADLRKDASQLQSTADVAIWDPSGRRG